MSDRLENLVWDLVACEQRPPLHPTTCAVMRLLNVLGGASFRQCASIIPCDVETVRQQLNRLCWQGLVMRETVKRLGRTAKTCYYLTPAGARMVKLWEIAYDARLERLRKELGHGR